MTKCKNTQKSITIWLIKGTTLNKKSRNFKLSWNMLKWHVLPSWETRAQMWKNLWTHWQLKGTQIIKILWKEQWMWSAITVVSSHKFIQWFQIRKWKSQKNNNSISSSFVFLRKSWGDKPMDGMNKKFRKSLSTNCSMLKFKPWTNQNMLLSYQSMLTNSIRPKRETKFIELNLKSKDKIWKWWSKKTTNSMTLKDWLSSSTKDSMRTGCFGFGTSTSNYMERNKEFWFTNGRLSIWQTLINCLQWLSRTRNKEKITKEERPSCQDIMWILSITMLQDNFWRTNSSKSETKNNHRTLSCWTNKNMEMLQLCLPKVEISVRPLVQS